MRTIVWFLPALSLLGGCAGLSSYSYSPMGFPRLIEGAVAFD